jgi:beta-lactamase superfamily II metal-dependent hydrolase
MQLTIFNLGHGSCALLIADNNNVALFDCGHDDDIGFRPSTHLPAAGITAVEQLVISHYDQDHVSDLANLRRTTPIKALRTNRSLDPRVIRGIKQAGGPIEPGVSAAIDMATSYSDGMTEADWSDVSLGNTELLTFHHDHPDFEDTNNLSVVSFIRHPNLNIILPGDLEQDGWRAFLGNSFFQENLREVNVFVASHHGRINGYVEEVLEISQPDIVVISETAIQYGTQEHQYGKHATGITWNGGPQVRRTLTTRRDGNIKIETKPQGGYYITAGA